MALPVVKIVLAFEVLAAVFISPACGLRCYSCHLEPRRNECTDATALFNARRKFENIVSDRNLTNFDVSKLTAQSDFIAECSNSIGNQHCVMESIIVQGQYKLMYRDCSDGKQFSANVTGTRLTSVPADNNTHCTYQEKIQGMVCITLCSGDFCNGPSPSAASLTQSGLNALFLLCFSLVVVLRAAS